MQLSENEPMSEIKLGHERELCLKEINYSPFAENIILTIFLTRDAALLNLVKTDLLFICGCANCNVRQVAKPSAGKKSIEVS